MKNYADILTMVHRLKRNMIHQEVTEEIQTLMNEKHYRFIQALKKFFDETRLCLMSLLTGKKKTMMIGVQMRNLIRI